MTVRTDCSIKKLCSFVCPSQVHHSSVYFETNDWNRSHVTETPVTRTAPAPPQSSGVIATAPLTSSTARFVSAVPAISQAPIPVTHISHPSPFLSNFAANQIRSVPAVPTSQLGHAVHLLPSDVPVLPAARAHLLADSSTDVFTGYFSFPSAGIDFDF